MISLQIEIDEESDRFLTQLADAFGGDRGKAVMELLRSRQPSEEELDEAERISHDDLSCSWSNRNEVSAKGALLRGRKSNGETACNGSVRRWRSGDVRRTARKSKT